MPDERYVIDVLVTPQITTFEHGFLLCSCRISFSYLKEEQSVNASNISSICWLSFLRNSLAASAILSTQECENRHLAVLTLVAHGLWNGLIVKPVLKCLCSNMNLKQISLGLPDNQSFVHLFAVTFQNLIWNWDFDFVKQSFFSSFVWFCRNEPYALHNLWVSLYLTLGSMPLLKIHVTFDERYFFSIAKIQRKAIVKYWWIWMNFHQSLKKCSILIPDIR